MTGNFPGFANIESSLRQIITAINGLNTSIGEVDASIDAIETTLATAFPAPLTGSATFDPANLLTLTQDIATLTVSGAALGNFVQASFSLDLQGITVSAYVSAPNAVKVVFFNGTSGTINLASGTVRVRVIA